MTEPIQIAGATKGGVTLILRLEGAAVLLASLLAFDHLGGGWGRFALLFLLPDASMLGYLRNPRWGAALYNAGHSYLLPAVLALGAWTAGAQAVFALLLIWTAHIGFDRMVGYGLKYAHAFGATHLGWPFGLTGKAAMASNPRGF
jgi:hypothetical protein